MKHIITFTFLLLATLGQAQEPICKKYAVAYLTIEKSHYVFVIDTGGTERQKFDLRNAGLGEFYNHMAKQRYFFHSRIALPTAPSVPFPAFADVFYREYKCDD